MNIMSVIVCRTGIVGRPVGIVVSGFTGLSNSLVGGHLLLMPRLYVVGKSVSRYERGVYILL